MKKTIAMLVLLFLYTPSVFASTNQDDFLYNCIKVKNSFESSARTVKTIYKSIGKKDPTSDAYISYLLAAESYNQAALNFKQIGDFLVQKTETNKSKLSNNDLEFLTMQLTEISDQIKTFNTMKANLLNPPNPSSGIVHVSAIDKIALTDASKGTSIIYDPYDNKIKVTLSLIEIWDYVQKQNAAKRSDYVKQVSASLTLTDWNKVLSIED